MIKKDKKYCTKFLASDLVISTLQNNTCKRKEVCE